MKTQLELRLDDKSQSHQMMTQDQYVTTIAELLQLAIISRNLAYLESTLARAQATPDAIAPSGEGRCRCRCRC